MIKIKHLLETVEPDDGKRIWVESIGLTRDLQEWCSVTHLLSNLGPPMTIWRWCGILGAFSSPRGATSWRSWT